MLVLSCVYQLFIKTNDDDDGDLRTNFYRPSSNHAVYAVVACKCLCVSMSVTSRCSTKTDKRSIIPIKRSISVMDFGLSMPNIFMKFERGHPQQRRQNVCG